jgi:hypothetical protein
MDRSKFEEMMAKNPPTEVPVETPAGGQLTVGFDVVELTKVNLGPGDVLMVTVKNDDMSEDSVHGLRKALGAVFPNNKVFVFAMGTSDSVDMSVLSQEVVDAVGKPLDSCGSVGYCNDCNCGKKEAAEGNSNAQVSETNSG